MARFGVAQAASGRTTCIAISGKVERTTGGPRNPSAGTYIAVFIASMLDPIRQEIAARSKTIVIKVGTRVLTHGDGTLDQERVTAIAEQIVRLMEETRHVVLVSSGAVAAGMGRLGLGQRPSD